MLATSKLRQLIEQPGIIVAPGAYDCLTAKIIQQSGFPAVYMTGAGTSVARYGFPDLALASMTEMISNAADITASVSVPVIADADTGYGGLLNVQHTIQGYENAGVAAVQIEDQEFPKKCGHTLGRRVVDESEMADKIAVACEKVGTGSKRCRDFSWRVHTSNMCLA